MPAWLKRRRCRREVAIAQKEPPAAAHSASSPSVAGGDGAVWGGEGVVDWKVSRGRRACLPCLLAA